MLNKLLQRFWVTSQPVQDDSRWCPVCDNKHAGFLPLPDVYREKANLYGFPYFEQGEMLSLDAYSCSACGASDRERLYALWIDQQFEKGSFTANTSVIHFAPESALSEKLKGLNLSSYKTADLLMEHADFKVDMMAMPFADDSYDFFVCSHVLEHVESDDRAIRELYRVTKPGGYGILMVPIIIGLEHTLEDLSTTDESERYRLYGQEDHVRLYAHEDYVNKIKSHGFYVEELGESYFGQEVFSKLGLTSTSILYVVGK